MRRKICGRCNFKPWKKGREKCEDCGSIFPCDISDGIECGHLDCPEARGVPEKCLVCRKPITSMEDRFCVATPGRSNYAPAHRSCVDVEAEVRIEVERPWNGSIGAAVKISEKLDGTYRSQYGDLVDDLAVENVTEDGRNVIVRWIGMVPVTHLRAK